MDGKGNLWVAIQDSESPKIIGLNTDGKSLGKDIVLERLATDLAVSGNELFVANRTCPIPVYNIGGNNIDKPTRTFGKSIDDVSPKGSLADDVVLPPRAIKFDKAGNVYVLSTWMRATFLRVYNSKGKLLWQTHGTSFSTCGGFSPDGSSIYSARTRHELRGERWEPVAVTIDEVKYPHDPRLRNIVADSIRVFESDGKRFVYIFFTQGVGFYRTEVGSEILIPAGFFKFSKNEAQFRTTFFDNQPKGLWIWVDENGDTSPQTEEYVSMEQWSSVFPGYVQGFHLDQTGALTFGMHRSGAGRLELAEINEHGAPVYGELKNWKIPALVITARALFDHSRNLLYVNGFDSSLMKTRDSRLAGNRMIRYQVSDEGLVEDWSREIEYDFTATEYPQGPRGIESLSLSPCGFVLFLGDRLSSDVHIHNASNGERIGTMLRDQKLHGGHSSWLDVTDAVDSVRLPNGDYLIQTENVSCQGGSVYRLTQDALRKAQTK